MYKPYSYFSSGDGVSGTSRISNRVIPSNYVDYYGNKPVEMNSYGATIKPSASQNTNNNNADDLSTMGNILGAIVCFLLFCLIIFSIAYPFTMYRTTPPHDHVYSDDMWWCYHCNGMNGCASHCW